MTLRGFLGCLALFPFVLLCTGCTAVRPNHVTVFCERDEAETDGRTRQRTTTVKTGVSATYDLPR